MCTVGLVRVQPAGRHARLSVALGGHPPPLLIGAGGEPALVGEPGTLLGMIDPIEVNEVPIELAPGETLLLYTDGLPDAGRSGRQLGELGLMSLCAQAHRDPLERLLERIARAALDDAGGKLRDDIAMLALRL